MMKAPVLFLLTLATTVTTQAQWTTDLSANTAVRAVTAGEAAVPLMADGPEGSTYVCWFENGSGDYQLRMQRLDAGGNKLWADEGLLISDHPQNSAIFRYDLKSDADGKAVVAFQDERTGTLDVVAYKIAPDGTFIWGPDGVELPSPGTTGLAPSIATLSNGNTAISWNMDSTPRSVGVQLVDPDGALLLATPIVVSAAVNLTNFRPVATSDGGFLLFYGVSAGGFGLPPWVLHAQRYDAVGTPVWANPVQVSSKSIAFFHYPNAVPDGHDGFYVAFNTSNPDNASLTDVYLQRVRGNGTLWSAEGTRLDDSNTTQKFTGGRGVAWVNDNSGMMVALQVTDINQAQSGISVQRVDTAGVRQLGDQAPTVLAVGAQAVQPWDVSATGDGALILHATTAGFNQTTLAATRVALDGTAMWDPAQQDICTLSSGKDDMRLSGLQNGQMVAVWQDGRTPAGIYAQNITGLDIGTAVVDRAVAGSGIRLESNPAVSPVLLMPGTAAALNVAVYDQQGRQVYAGEVASTAGRSALPLGALPAGAYAIRCLHDGQATVLRWVK
jgi:hypothetical protein